jgi:hypothetical protein
MELEEEGMRVAVNPQSPCGGQANRGRRIGFGEASLRFPPNLPPPETMSLRG